MSPAVAPLLFQRRCVLKIGAATNDATGETTNWLTIDGLRVQFRVTKTLTKNPNTCDITLTGLAETTRRQMAKKHAKVILSAGYSDTVGQIFAGDSRTIDHVRKGADWETLIQCGDGEKAFQFSRVSESFPPGTPVSTVIERLARGTGLDVGNALKQAQSGSFRGNIQQFAQGYVAHGKASTELGKILKTAGFDWSIQDGSLQLLRPEERSQQQVVLLSLDTGLVGSPEHGAPNKKGKPSVLKAKSLLQPNLRPGGRVEIQSRSVSGQLRIEKVIHTGDTAGGAWYSELECKP